MQDLLAALDQAPPEHAQHQMEHQARDLAMRIVLAVQAALLLLHAPRFVAQAFVVSRLREHGPGACFGGLPYEIDCAALIARAWPAGAA